MTTQPPPPQNGNELPIPSVTAPHNRWARLAFTILPLLVYPLAECITFSSITLWTFEPFWSSSVTHSIVALGIVPWIIAAVIVELIVFVIPQWRHLRHGANERAKLYWAANILGLLIAAFQAYSIASMLTLDFTLALTPSWEFYVPYSRPLSPIRVFVTLVIGTMFVKLLADLVTRRGLMHGYLLFFAGGLLFSTLRTIGREHRHPQWTDMYKLSGSVLVCIVLMVLILKKLRSPRRAIETDRVKNDLIDEGDINNPYAPPQRS